MRRIYYLSAVLLCCVGAFMVYQFLFGRNVVLHGETTYVYIPTGASFAQVEDSLSPYLKNPTAFEELAELKNYPALIRPGRYKIVDGMRNVQLIDMLRSGAQSPIKLVFNQQESLSSFAAAVASQIEPDEQAIYKAFLDKEFLTQHGLDSETVRQLLIPDTYFVYWDISATAFRDRMLSEYQKFWDANRWAAARAEDLTPLQVSTLASIVQQETSKVDEMPTVARLYLNRLKHNWKLESDPTVIYALKLCNGFDKTIRRVLYKDLKIDSPYNTYKYHGLPPAPIMIPDKQALEAVLYAKKHDYYFMVANPSRPGYHYFSKNFANHKCNRVKHDAWIKKQGIRR